MTDLGGQIRAADLRPGDVLLCRGRGEISDLVCALDESTYSHSALWDGDRVAMRRSPHPVDIIASPLRTRFQILRAKLRWGER